MNTAKTVSVKLKAHTTEFNKKMQDVTKKTKSMEGKMSKSLKKIGLAIGGAFAVKKLFDFGKALTMSASDWGETLNKTSIAFGDQTEAMKEWAKTSNKTMGMSRTQALDTASGFMLMANGMDVATEQGAKMSKDLAVLSADLGSLFNTSQEMGQTALAGVFTGETEALKKYGIVMTQANLEQYAMSKGIKKSYKEMTQAEKVQLRYNFVMDSTTQAHGDFANTVGESLPNKLKSLKASLTNVMTTLGEYLLPVVLTVITAIENFVGRIALFVEALRNGGTETVVFKDVLMGVFEALKTAFQVFVDMWIAYITTIKNAVSEWVANNGELLEEMRDNFEQIFENIKAIINRVVVFVMMLWYMFGEKIISTVVDMYGRLSALFSEVLLFVTEVFNEIISVVRDWVIQNKDLFDRIINIVKMAFDIIMATLKTTFAIIKWLWENVFSYLLKYLMGILAHVLNVITTAIDIILNTINFFRGLLTGNWTLMWDSIKNIFVAVWEFIKKYFNIVWNTFSNMFGGLANSISNIWTGMWDGIKNGVKDAWEWLKAKFKVIGDALKNIFKVKIKMPKFGITGSLNPIHWAKQGLPKLNVKWLAKGGITNGTVFGAGEAGREAIIPLDRLPKLLGLDNQKDGRPFVINLDGRKMAEGIMPHTNKIVRTRTVFN